MNIKDMVSRLIESGMSEAEIAVKVGVSQPTVNRVKQGNQRVSYETGKQIEFLYSSMFEDKAA